MTRFLKFRRHKNQIAKKPVPSGRMGIVIQLKISSIKFSFEQQGNINMLARKLKMNCQKKHQNRTNKPIL